MSHRFAMPKGAYPEPLPIYPGEVKGNELIVPVWLEDYDRGYHPTVQDIYEPGARMKDDGTFDVLWTWLRRERVFTRPLHYDRDGKEFRCEECEAYWSRYPERKTEILKEREGSFITAVREQVEAMERRNDVEPR